MESLHGVIRGSAPGGARQDMGIGGVDDDQQREAKVDETGNHLREGWAGGCGKLMAGIPASDEDKNTYRLSRHPVHESDPCGPGSSCMTGI